MLNRSISRSGPSRVSYLARARVRGPARDANRTHLAWSTASGAQATAHERVLFISHSSLCPFASLRGSYLLCYKSVPERARACVCDSSRACPMIRRVDALGLKRRCAAHRSPTSRKSQWAAKMNAARTFVKLHVHPSLPLRLILVARKRFNRATHDKLIRTRRIETRRNKNTHESFRNVTQLCAR